MATHQDNGRLKRKRHEEASRILSRPFVTPLKQARSKHSTGGPSDRAITEPSLHKYSKSDELPVASQGAPSDESVRSTTLEAVTDHDTVAHGSSSMSATASASKTSDKVPIARQIRHLELQLHAIRGDIDTLERSASIQSSRNDDYLRSLIVKWRGVAQEAADSLFPEVKDRVDRMGGLDAWRHVEEPRTGLNDAFSCDASNDNTRVLSQQFAEEAEMMRMMPDYTKSTEAGSEGDVSFSMEKMLQTLHIKPSLIGYDVKTENWNVD